MMRIREYNIKYFHDKMSHLTYIFCFYSENFQSLYPKVFKC